MDFYNTLSSTFELQFKYEYYITESLCDYAMYILFLALMKS